MIENDANLFSKIMLNIISIESKNIVELPQPIAKHKRPEFQETFGELSTLPEGLEVAVRRDGAVRVINAESWF